MRGFAALVNAFHRHLAARFQMDNSLSDEVAGLRFAPSTGRASPSPTIPMLHQRRDRRNGAGDGRLGAATLVALLAEAHNQPLV